MLILRIRSENYMAVSMPGLITIETAPRRPTGPTRRDRFTGYSHSLEIYMEWVLCSAHKLCDYRQGDFSDNFICVYVQHFSET